MWYIENFHKFINYNFFSNNWLNFQYYIMGNSLTIRPIINLNNQTRDATHVFVHPNYNTKSLVNDVAVIRVRYAVFLLLLLLNFFLIIFLCRCHLHSHSQVHFTVLHV